MKYLSREEYIEEIKYCYENSRWEFSFYAILYSYLCQFRNNKIKLVHCADWKSRGVNTSPAMIENLELCSIRFEDKDGKEHIGGIPDFQFVPSIYSYGTPCQAKVFIEFKAPVFSDEGVYKPLRYSKTCEIEHEFEKCSKIIFTDGISWYFIKKDKIECPAEFVNLLDDNDHWDELKTKITNFIEKN